MSYKELWLWNWYLETGMELGYKGEYNPITKEYSLYSPIIKNRKGK